MCTIPAAAPCKLLDAQVRFRPPCSAGFPTNVWQRLHLRIGTTSARSIGGAFVEREYEIDPTHTY
jgi:hypothetical protein